MSLFNFIFNTLRTRVNDKDNQRFWLPAVLEDLSGSNEQGKLLPLTVGHWDAGAISGEAGTTITNSFISNYSSYLEKVKKVSFAAQKVIASPDTPAPGLSFANTTIGGLQNLWVMDNPPTRSGSGGYETVVTLQTNYYDGSDGKPSLTLFGLSGNYLLSQDLCTADNATPSVCNGNYSDNIDGRGKLAITFTNAYIRANLKITVSGTGNDRTLSVTITQLTFLGAYNEGTAADVSPGDLSPGFTIDSLDIVADVSPYLINVWVAMSKKALTSPEGQAGIFQQINSSLNEPSNLKSISDAMTPRLMSALDKMMGAVPAGRLPDDSGQQLPNPADIYIFDRLRYALNSPTGQWYLPGTVCAISQPSVEPLHIDSIPLPDQNAGGVNYTQIRLINILATGLSNLQAPSDQLLFDVDGSLNGTVDIGVLDPPPQEPCNGKKIPSPPLTCTGSFSLLPEGMGETLTGSFTLTIDLGKLQFQSVFSGGDLDQLDLTLQTAVILADPSRIKLSLEIDSVFREFINQALNSRSILTTITGQLNDAIKKNLGSISRELSKATARGIASRLDG